MALDFHNNLDKKQHLFAVESRSLVALEKIFDEFQRWTGINIDEYGDCTIDVGNQKKMLKIIDDYIQKTDLNQDKQKTILMIEFRSMIKYFSDRKIDLRVFGD